MIFTSFTFVVFFAVVSAAYFALKNSYRKQNALLLVASYVFYGWWDVRFLHLIVVSTVLDFTSALMIDSGRISVRGRVVASVAGIGSAIAFLCVPAWWSNHALGTIEWFGLAATTAWVVAANFVCVSWSRLPEAIRRKRFVTASIVANLGILAVFKYYDFFAASLSAAVQSTFGVHMSDWTLNIVLPVGISFYTFQTMSYTIDVYRRDLPACPSLLDFAAYVSFFPQLVAGPIERGETLIPQFRGSRVSPTAAERSEAWWLIAWGFFKKVVVADNAADIVNATFAPFDALGTGGVADIPNDGVRLLVGVYAFALQIYGDFSGYTDIARGVAKLLGFDLITNFNLPYFARSPSDFWRRWHISLSTWLRDYLYIPLGGNRGSGFATSRNLLLTMLLGGLWHGANWTFVLWGAYHGVLLILFRAFERSRPAEIQPSPGWLRALQTIGYLQLTCLGWLIFRAQNMETIGIFLRSIIQHFAWSPQASVDALALAKFSWFLILFEFFQWRSGVVDPQRHAHWFVRLNAWFVVVFSTLVFFRDDAVEFIYFAF